MFVFHFQPFLLHLRNRMPLWALILVIVGALSALYSYPPSLDRFGFRTGSSTTRGEDINSKQWDVLRHLGGNSPWIAKTVGLAENSSTDVPHGCRVDQVHMVGLGC